MQKTDMLQQVTIRNLGPIEHLSFREFGNINLMIGENGTHKIEIIFVLVIKNHEKAWLKDVKDALEISVRSVHRMNKIWKCKVLVMNEEMAKKSCLMRM